MSNVIITLITVLLFNTVSAQLPTYLDCPVFQYGFDESDTASSVALFGTADLDNKTPGGGSGSKWEYLKEFAIYGEKGAAITSTLNFDIITGGDPNTVVNGRVYGFKTTTSNFTFAINAFLVVPKTGYYTFNIAATEGAFMTIIQINDAYCCDPGDAEPNLDFYVANLQSDPENNLLENSIYLLAGFRYSFALMYLNTNGANPSLHVTVTDPDGVTYNDIGQFLRRVVSMPDDYCYYQTNASTTTIEWQSSTTATSLKYVTSTNDVGSRVVESLYIVQVPSSTPIPSSSSEIEGSSTTELSSSSAVASSSEPVSSSTVETSSELTSESFSSSVAVPSTASSEPEAPSTSFSESEYPSTLSSGEESTNAVSSQSSSYSDEESSTSATNFVSQSVTESSWGSSETLASTTGESSSFSTLASQSEPVTSSDTAVVSQSEGSSSTTILLSSITSSGELDYSGSSSLVSETAGSSSSKVNTVSSDGNQSEDSSGNGNSELQTTHYITETSVIRTTITTLCSTPTLHPEASAPSLEKFTSTYVSEFTTTVTLTSCTPGTCQVGSIQTGHETTEIQGKCTQDCVTATTEWESSSKKIIIGTTNPISIDDSKATSSKKPYVAVSSSQSPYDSTTSHTVIQNVNMSSHITYDVFMFIFSMLMSLIIGFV